MKRITISILASIAMMTPAIAQAAPVAGSTLIGVSVTELRDVTLGWSTKHQLLGESVFNAKSEQIGTIDDVIIAPDKSASYAIIGAGGFLGMDKHDVAIPVAQIRLVGGKFVLAGATKDALEAMPAFEYAQ